MADNAEYTVRIESLLKAIIRRMSADDLLKIEADKKLRTLYAVTGTMSVREIEKKTGIPRATISRIWQSWERLGLLCKEGKTFVKTTE